MKNSDSLLHFLIVYNHADEELEREISTFESASEATEAYAATEKLYASDDNVEVVLLGSDSLATVRRTHPNYFDGQESFNEMIEAMLAG